MGGPRVSTQRMRSVGKMCAHCHAIFEPPCSGRDRLCDQCSPRTRVYMQFVSGDQGWRVTFLDKDLRTALPRTILIQDEQKIIDMAKRGGADWTSADRETIDFAIRQGKGAVWLNLSQAQYQTLFPFLRLNGTQPLFPDMVLNEIIRPALIEAEITGKVIGWHSFRHSLATKLRSMGVEVKVTQELLRHANSRITLDLYIRAVSSDKREASGRQIKMLMGGSVSVPSCVPSAT